MVRAGSYAIAIVPARGGSKSTAAQERPARSAGHPLLAWSIAAGPRGAARAPRARLDRRSPSCATIAMRYGAEAPFLRPAELAGDRHARPAGLQARAAVARGARGRTAGGRGAPAADVARCARRAWWTAACARLLRGRPTPTRCAPSCPARRTPTRSWRLEDGRAACRCSSRSTACASRTTSRARRCPPTFWQTGHLDVVRRETVPRAGLADRRAGPAARRRSRPTRSTSTGPTQWADAERLLQRRPRSPASARPDGRQPASPASAWSSSTSTACSPTTASTVDERRRASRSSCNRADGAGLAALRAARRSGGRALGGGERRGGRPLREARLPFVQGVAGQGARPARAAWRTEG